MIIKFMKINKVKAKWKLYQKNKAIILVVNIQQMHKNIWKITIVCFFCQICQIKKNKILKIVLTNK